VLAHEEAKAAAEGQAGDAGRGDRTARHSEPVKLRLAVELGPGDAALSPRRAGGRVDVNSLHRPEVDHETAVRDGPSGDVVPAAADRDLEIAATGGTNRLDDVGRALTPGDQGRPPVDHRVVHAADLVVVLV
jgi:hypothetical protein